MAQVVLPQLGEGIKTATVSFWFHKEQDTVEKGKDLVELTTDKATFNLPSPVSGVLTKILIREGETVNIGSTLAEINDFTLTKPVF